MRLIWFTMTGYKRFEAKTGVHLDGRLIAISGPNEAGKSSLLGALSHLSKDGEFSSRELTRRTSIPNEQVIIRAMFLLGRDDLAAVSDLNDGPKIRWLIVEKLRGGAWRYGVDPKPTRDLHPRQRTVTALRKLEPAVARAEAKRIPPEDEEPPAEDEVRPLTSAEIKSLADALDVDTANLSSGTHERLGEISAKLRVEADGYGTAGNRALKLVETLVIQENDHPEEIARRRLFNRRPQFLPFAEAERTLNGSYDLVNDLPSLPPTAALRNLAELAQLNLDELATAAGDEDRGLVDTLTKRANERLAERFRISWRQSEITVRFWVDLTTLSVLIESPHEASSEIEDRSDGMRSFIALLAYTAVKGDATRTPPVLLIDEAELHLHYAAQADLVQVLTEQTVASQVIYTTHSAGCLPEDIGTGVRLVVPLQGQDRSRVINWFWEDDQPGFGSLLFGMGYAAGAFAFTPARFAVFTEGPTELMLLPALFRDATGKRRLEFQIAPGLALVNRETASTLELEAARVKYVVDSDTAGNAIKRVLRGGGVRDDDIFDLRDGDTDGLTIEDFVDGEAYRLAINEELRRSGHPAHQLDVGEIPDAQRVAFVQAWANDRGIGNPSKVKVAGRIVELREERKLTSGSRRQAIKVLYNELYGALGIKEARDAGLRL
jgi:hypothetical protein